MLGIFGFTYIFLDLYIAAHSGIPAAGIGRGRQGGGEPASQGKEAVLQKDEMAGRGDEGVMGMNPAR